MHRFIWLAALLPLLAQPAGAQSRMDMFKLHGKLLDGRLSNQYRGSQRLIPSAKGAVPRYGGEYRGVYYQMAQQVADRHGIPRDLFLRLIQTESGWRQETVSSKGAIGLTQLLPATARLLGVDPRDPAQNLDGGARYLRRQFNRFRTWRLALAAYNAGPGAVEKFNDVPPFAETQAYVAEILGR